MRAAIYNGKENVEFIQLPTPHAKDTDIIIRNLYAGICGTDVAVYQQGPHTGHRISVGSEFGHEMVSEVAEVGCKVQDIHLGDIVYPYPLLAKGEPERAGTLGGFSEYIRIPDAQLYKNIYPVPSKIPLKTACLIEPFTVGFRAARRACPKHGEKAVVFGAGTIGIASAIGLKYFGCDDVMLCDVSALRLQKAEDLGFSICHMRMENLQEKAMRVFGTAPSLHGATADVSIYIDAAGALELLEMYQSMGKIESRMVVVAVQSALRSIDVLDMVYSQHALIGSGGYMPEDVWDVMHMMEKGDWDIEHIITHEFAWEDLCTALQTAGDPKHALNVMIRY